MAGRKHVPERTCVACRRTAPKRDLVRVVRTAEGRVLPDPTGKASGRGAYIGAARECLALALERRGLERSLKAAVSDEDRAALEKELYKRRASCPLKAAEEAEEAGPSEDGAD